MNLFLQMKQIKDLSPSERQVVNYILEEPEQALNMGIVEIAQKTFTSTSSVLRLCRKLGTEGYTDFRMRLSTDLNDYIGATLLYTRQEPLNENDTIAEIVDKVTASNVRAVLDVKRFNEETEIERVVDMMSAAEQIDFYGSGVSNLICQDAKVKAMRMGVRATAHSFYYEMAMQARTCSKNNLAVILSYTGQTEDTLRVATYLQRRGVPSVSITSHSDNPLLPFCDVNLYVDSAESIYRIGGMSSRLSSLHLVDVLFSAFLNRNHVRLQSSIDATFLPETFHDIQPEAPSPPQRKAAAAREVHAAAGGKDAEKAE